MTEPNETDWRPMWELEELEYLASEDADIDRILDELRQAEETDYAPDSH